ncbi:hypothetical protein HGRIS_010763 [Hohenbuehelia grisea]|uniref:Protein phosphatase n=1 Tax=Hohenbuehelia grisea TaxID=104357 RepID=A0ABR3IXS2_9AGAR
MKSIQKRIYTVLPRAVSSSSSSSSATTQGLPSSLPSSSSTPLARARSNSASSSTSAYSSTSSSRSLYTSTSSSGSPLAFFDSPPPPPPSSRGHPHVLSTSRLPVEAKHQADVPPNPPFSLALTTSLNNSSYAAQSNGTSNAYALFSNSHFKAGSLAAADATGAKGKEKRVAAKRQRPKYQLNVGAYGIPKRCSTGVGGREGHGPHARMIHHHAREDAHLAVQVGEDAYFIRDNAMGVADGVGGWAKARCSDKLSSRSFAVDNSPSALFARRLMHFCSAEMDSIPPSPSLSSAHAALHTGPSLPSASFLPQPCVSPPSWLSTPSPLAPSSINSTPIVNAWPWSDEYDLQHELEEELEELEEGIDVLMILEQAYEKTLKAHVMPAPVPEPPRPKFYTSEAGLPIPSVSFCSSPPKSAPISTSAPDLATTIPLMAGSSTALLAVLDHIPAKKAATVSEPNVDSVVAESESEAVIKIAHVGDCMAMLVRGDDIAWRSEEMWWDFNTPVQLGPSSPAQPATSAQLFTLPVQADDILILASDGLSDNLWDEDVVDEVVRFRKSFLESESDSHTSTTRPSSANQESIGSSKETAADRVLRRRTLAGMLSEALCSRARKVSERRAAKATPIRRRREGSPTIAEEASAAGTAAAVEEDEVPFARRAREAGKVFRGGKNDDISVIVAVISPAADLAQQKQS